MNDLPKLSGIILAAGFSSRMKAFKPLLNYDGKSFIINIIEKLSTICNTITVVTGFKAEDIQNHLNDFLSPKLKENVSIKFNPGFENGMFSSLKKGLEESPGSEWFIYHFIDQPNIPPAFYKEFVLQLNSNFDWIQPAYNQRKGHPVLFNKTVKKAILNASLENTLKQISGSVEKKKVWDCNYPEILIDFDTPEELERLKIKNF